MLLFLISFYVHYDLFNCDETVNANFNESLIVDTHHQNLLQVDAFLKEHKRLSGGFHPSPQFDPSDHRQDLLQWLPPVLKGLKVPLPPLVVSRPSPPQRMAIFPLENPGQRPGSPNPGYIFRPMHSMFPRPPPRLLSDYRYQNVYLRPPAPYLLNPSYTPGTAISKRLPFLYAVNRYIQKNPHLINPLHSTISPLIADAAVSSKIPPPVTIPSLTIRTSTIGYNAKVWLQEIAPYTPVNEQYENPSEDQSSPRHSVHTTVSVTNRMPNTNDYRFSTGTANKGPLFKEDAHGFLYVTVPEKDGRPVSEPTDTNKNWMTTVVRDVLHGRITAQTLSPTPNQRYLGLMEQLNEGYMTVFMIELCRMISVKDRLDVRDVLHHTEMIYNSLWANGRLAWIGDPLETVIWKLSIIMSGRDIDLVRTYASMMFHMLLQRKQTLSAEVNSIIDDADLFYTHDEGDRLLYSLKQFEDYPNTTKNSYWLCDSLIESFLLPFRRLSGTRRRQRLIDSINKALRQRFPLLSKEHNEGTLAGQGRQSRNRKRKRHHLPHKKIRERKRQQKPEYSNKKLYDKQYRQDILHIDYNDTIMRTMTHATSSQLKFRVATSTAYTTKKSRPLTVYFNTRSIKNRRPSYLTTTSFQEKLDSFEQKTHKTTKKTVKQYYHFSRKTFPARYRSSPKVKTSTNVVLLASSRFQSPSRLKRAQEVRIPFYQTKEKFKKSEAKKDKQLKIKGELLIKITKSSSCSDEEQSLTKNLKKALKNGNRTVDFVDETK